MDKREVLRQLDQLHFELIWDTEKDGYKAYCPYCGKRLMLCSACHDDGFVCNYDSETDGCRWNPGRKE